MPNLRSRIDQEELREIAGQVEFGRRVYYVETDQSNGLEDAIADTSDVPKAGLVWSESLDELILEERTVSYIGKNSDGTHKYSVECIYRLQTLEPRLVDAAGGVRQVRTQQDQNGDQITVKHDGNTQGGEVDVTQSMSVLTYEWVAFTNDPESIKDQYQNRINGAEFKGGSAGEWKIGDVEYEVVDRLIRNQFAWRFRATMERDKRGWPPVVAYRDPDTNEIPDGLVVGEGIKTVEWYDIADFSFFDPAL